MDYRDAVKQVDSTAGSLTVAVDSTVYHYVRGLFPNGVESTSVPLLLTGLFNTEQDAWKGAHAQLEARNGGRYN